MKHYLFFVKSIYFEFRVNYLHIEVEWPIKTESKHLWDAISNLWTREPELSQIIMLTNTKANEMVNKYEVLYHLNDLGLD